MNLKKILAWSLILIGVAILIHQYIFFNKIWEWSDALHHEWFAAIFIAFAAGLLMGLREEKA